MLECILYGYYCADSGAACALQVLAEREAVIVRQEAALAEKEGVLARQEEALVRQEQALVRQDKHGQQKAVRLMVQSPLFEALKVDSKAMRQVTSHSVKLATLVMQNTLTVAQTVHTICTPPLPSSSSSM